VLPWFSAALSFVPLKSLVNHERRETQPRLDGFQSNVTPHRKGVRIMKYTKPQVTSVASATDAIQSDHIKWIQVVYDNEMERASSPAYEADE
jgi:hypothetical protein